MPSQYSIQLDEFEGPLDLLLYLIRVHEIDIFKIDIYKLTKQYLEFLRHAEFSDLNDAAAFIEMAAILIEIKTNQLLPQNRKESDAENDSDPEDPGELLRKRLIEYDRFQKAAKYFELSLANYAETFHSHEWDRLTPKYEHVEAPMKGVPASLILLFEQMMRDLAERNFVKVEAKFHKITLEDTIEAFTLYIDTVEFLLFQGMYEKFKTRYDFVVHVLAVLELCKTGLLATHQERLMGPLWVYLKQSQSKQLPFLARAGAVAHTDSTDSSEEASEVQSIPAISP